MGGFLGSFGGSFIRSLWCAGQLSAASVAFFVVGGLAGVWLAARLRF